MSQFEKGARQIRFVGAYLRVFDLVEACTIADVGVDEGRTFLEDPAVKTIIDREMDFAFRRLAITPARTLLQVAEIAYKEPLLHSDDAYVSERGDILEFMSIKEQTKGLEILCKYQEVLGKESRQGSEDEQLLIGNAEDATAVMARLKGSA